jgi:phosphoribosylanthranilate isomerase
MSMFVKICGLTDEIAAEACADAGVDAAGFVFTESPRRLTPERAARIASVLPEGIARVAVFRHPTRDQVDEVLQGFIPDLIQADHEVVQVLSGLPFLPVYRESASIDPEHMRFLYEGAVSGVGRVVDLRQAASTARLGEMILAGGLRPDNVGRVIAEVRPFGVDVSSGVESSAGVKDPALIRSFVAAARAAEERLVSA